MEIIASVLLVNLLSSQFLEVALITHGNHVDHNQQTVDISCEADATTFEGEKLQFYLT